jgi:hypothetical protein
MSVERLRARLLEFESQMTPGTLIQVPVLELRAAIREADALMRSLVVEPKSATSAKLRKEAGRE